jgi:hypothetical protein
MVLKGKPLSLAAKIVAAALVIAAFFLKMDIDGAIKAGLFIAGVFGTVDISLICQNVFGKR